MLYVEKYKPLKYRKVWLTIGYMLVLLTVAVCLMPNPPDTSVIQFGDKFLHMAGYIGLFLWFAQIYSRKNHYRPLIGLILLGIFIEFAQSLTSYRSFEVADMVANASGALLGWVVAGSFVSFALINFEALVFRKN